MPEHEIRTVTTLTKKRDEIVRAIAGYEKALAQARADLAAVSAAIIVFERPGQAAGVRAYARIEDLFRYGEMSSLCRAALADGTMTTPDIARAVAKAKGFDAGDSVLVKSLTQATIMSMRNMERGRKVKRLGRGRTITWALVQGD